MKRDLTNVVVLSALAGVVAIVMARSLWVGRSAPEPAMFREELTLEDAVKKGRDEHKPVMLVASADWCGPCQSYKRGALVDPEVEAWVGSHVVPVHVDLDRDRQLAERLTIDSIPATVVLKNGLEVDRRIGLMNGRELLSWLKACAGEGN